eukprot:1241009-Amphidinium_carterae.1
MLPFVEQTEAIAATCNFSDASLSDAFAEAQSMAVEDKNTSALEIKIQSLQSMLKCLIQIQTFPSILICL